MKYLFLLAVTGLLSLVACNNPEKAAEPVSVFSLDSARAQIAASNAKYGQYFANNDSAGFVSCYTSDGCISPPNSPQICSANGIGMFFRGGHQMGIRNIKLTTAEVFGGKEAVVETGTYEILGADGNTWDKGKFIVAWKEENGKWKMHRDEWNTDMPLAANP